MQNLQINGLHAKACKQRGSSAFLRRHRGKVACLEFYPFQYEEAGELICKFFELCLKVVRVGGPPAEGLLFGSFVVNA